MIAQLTASPPEIGIYRLLGAMSPGIVAVREYIIGVRYATQSRQHRNRKRIMHPVNGQTVAVNVAGREPQDPVEI